MKRCAALLYIVTYCFSLLSADIRDSVIIGILRDNAPYEFINGDDEPAGFNVELYKMIFDRLDLDYKFNTGDMVECLDRLERGEIDLKSLISATDERIKKFYFSIPITVFKYDIISRNDNIYKSLDELKNKKFIVKEGAYSKTYINAKLGEYCGNMMSVKDMSYGIKLVSSGMADAAVATVENSLNIIQKENINNLNISKSEIPEANLCIASNERYLMSDINRALSDIIKSGDFEKLQYKWFGKNDKKDISVYIISIFLSLLLIILITIIFSMTLKKRVNKATAALKKINDELVKSENNMKLILDSIPVPIYMKDYETNKIFYHNNEASKQFGIVDGISFSDLLSKDDERFIGYNEKHSILNEEYNETIKLKSGVMMDTYVKTITMDYKRLLSVRIDLSEQNKVTMFGKMLEISLPALKAFTWSVDTKEKKLYTQANIIYYNIDKVKDKVYNMIYKDDREDIKRRFQNFINKELKEDIFVFRIDLNEKDVYEWWETRVVMETITTKGSTYKLYYGISINIDARKRNELALQDSEKKLIALNKQSDIILNNSNSLLAYLDNDYHVHWSNSERIFSEEMRRLYRKGSTCYEIFNRNIPCEKCLLKESSKTGSPEYKEIQLKNGKHYSVVSIPVLSDVDKTPTGYVIKMDDITEHKDLIRTLENAKEKAVAVDKMKTAFLANMSHEIRTPLNAIIGFSELLQDVNYADDREMYINIIKTNSDLLLRLINDILDLSKIESGTMEIKIESFDAVEVFNQEFKTFCDKNNNPEIQFFAETDLTNCIVSLDRNRFLQIGINFLSNAFKYTSKGKITMVLSYVDNGLKISVKDTGIGIDKNIQHLVFKRFEKLDSFAQGSGLGLSICKAITDAFGGKIGFESELNVGSEFWAWFPCTVENEVVNQSDIKLEKEEPIVEGALKINKMSINILVAEDIDSNYKLLKSVLKNYNLTRAFNGLEAVELCKNNNYDIVLMDMRMPVMDGIKATEEIRRFNENIPIIGVSANAFYSDIEAGFKVGLNDFITKPIKKELLLTSLQKNLISE